MDEKRLTEACFILAENLMWEQQPPPVEKLPEQMDELSETTNKFVNIAKDNFYQVESLPDAMEILIGAIHYLNALAIPPLRGNFAWFDYSLAILLELANPNSSPGGLALPYFLRARNGIEQVIDWANQPDEEE